jgi:uncharacterized protein
MPRTALITGASAGIGKSFAEALAGAGFNLVLTARRVDRLEALAETLRAQHRIDCAVIAADLADPSAVEQLCTSLAARGLRVDYLVNNAGYGVPGKYLQPSWPTHAQFMQVLVTSVIELSYRLLPGMLERGYGRIINVASLAGLVPGSPGHTLYAASKAFLVKFSESLHAEYSRQGIHVCALCPGFTYSEFHDVTGTRSVVAKMPSYMWMSAEAVVEAGLDAVQRGEPVHVAGRVNRFIAWLMRTLPPALARRLINSRANSFRNAE